MRAVIVVLDGLGVGELPDASKFKDEGSNTLANLAEAVKGLNLPNFQALGLGNIVPVKGVPAVENPRASYGKMAEKSAGKDTTTGHWELMGIVLSHPFPTYPRGFPDEVIRELEEKIGRKVIGNKPASGTEIIEELGPKHLKTGFPIVYTSADSVFQIAAHLDVIPLEELYRICWTARSILKGKHAVGRVIARPFTGPPGSFRRTCERKDFSLQPPGKTVLDYAVSKGLPVYAIGKVGEIFAKQGITEVIPAHGNKEIVDKLIELMKEKEKGIIFANLVDFDMLWGHRNNPAGMAQGLNEVDGRIPQILENLKEEDLLIITADHGCDPTTPSTDHSREYVLLLALTGKFGKGFDLGVRESFADVGKTVAEWLKIDNPLIPGKSFLSLLPR